MAKTGSRRYVLPGLGVVLLVACLCLVVAAGGPLLFRFRPARAEMPGVEYVLDVSSRMSQPAPGGTASRLEIAQRTLAEVLRPAGETVAGLRVFGSGAAPQSCDDTSLVVPLEGANQQRIGDELDALQAGQAVNAALAQAMIAAIGDLAPVEGPKSLVVVTGGQDSCQDEAGRLIAAEADRAGIELRTFVIGFQTTAEEAEAIKEMVAAKGDSLYLDAQDEVTLRETLRTVQRYVEEPNEATLAAVAAQAPSPPLLLTESAGAAFGPEMVLDQDNRLHLVWWDDSLRPTGDVFYRRRQPDGTWTPAEAITADIDSAIGYDAHLRLRPDGAICAFFASPQELQYYMRCLVGDTWKLPEPVFRATGIKREVQPAFTSDGDLRLIYLDGAADIYYKDGQQIGQSARDLKLAITPDGRLHAIWVNFEATPFVEYRWSDDGGRSWAEAESISGAAYVDRPIALEADRAGNLHVAWIGQRVAGQWTINYRRWTPGGGWQPLSPITGPYERPGCDNIGLVVDQRGQAILAWQGLKPLYVARQDPLRQWHVTTVLSGPQCSWARVPEMAIGRDGVIHLVWSREGGDDDDLYYGSVAPVPLP
jgi:hypothetical protein